MHIKGKCDIFYVLRGVRRSASRTGSFISDPGHGYPVLGALKRKVGLQSYSTNTGAGIIDNRKPTGINL